MGTMVNEKSGHKPVPITIDGVTYDASGWMSHHPGGAAIIESYAGRDATDVFMVMHSQGALKTLKTLPRMNVCLPTASNDNKSGIINEDFQKLRQDIIQQGHFSCSPLWYTYKCTTTLGLMLLSTLIVMWGQWYTVGAVVMGLAYQQLGWLAHDFCHHQVFNNRRLNNFFGLFFGNFCQGFSVTWWKERHNGHHASTNVVGHDPDIDNLPLLAWDLYDIRRAAPSSKKIIRYQHWYFLPLVSLLRYIWCTQSILMVKSLRHHPNRAFRKQYSTEATLLLLHYIARLVFLVVMMPSVATAVWFSVISDIVGGFGIAIIVFLNHYPIPKVPGEEWPDMPFAVCQLENTVNVRRGIVTDWICGGLNYQIEHHLFPTLPRHNLSSITPQVKAFCKKHNLSYRDPQMYSAIYNLLKYAKSMALAAAYK